MKIENLPKRKWNKKLLANQKFEKNLEHKFYKCIFSYKI